MAYPVESMSTGLAGGGLGRAVAGAWPGGCHFFFLGVKKWLHVHQNKEKAKTPGGDGRRSKNWSHPELNLGPSVRQTDVITATQPTQTGLPV